MKESSSPQLQRGSEARWRIDTRRVAESAPCEQAERRPTDLPPWRFPGRGLNWQCVEQPFQRILLSTDCLHAVCRLRSIHVQGKNLAWHGSRIHAAIGKEVLRPKQPRRP